MIIDINSITHLKLCLATAIHNVKRIKITHICTISMKIYAKFANLMPISPQERLKTVLYVIRWRATSFFFQFKIIITVLVSSFWFIWIPMLLSVYGHLEIVLLLQCGDRLLTTKVDPRAVMVKPSLLNSLCLKGINDNVWYIPPPRRRKVGIQCRQILDCHCHRRKGGPEPVR